MFPPTTEPCVTCQERLVQTPGLGHICSYVTTMCRLSQVLKDPIQPKIRKTGGRGAAFKQKGQEPSSLATLPTLTFTAQPGEASRGVWPKSGAVRPLELSEVYDRGQKVWESSARQEGLLTASQTLSCPGSGSHLALSHRRAWLPFQPRAGKTDR